MRQTKRPLRATTKTMIVMAGIALGLAGSILFGGERDHGGHGEKPWLGVFLDGSSSKSGLHILRVIEDSPAEKAGMKDGDVIIILNGVDIRGENDFHSQFRKLQPDDTVEMVVLRDDGEIKIKVILGDQSTRPHFAFPHLGTRIQTRIHQRLGGGEMRRRGFLGVNLQEMTDDLRVYFDVPEGEGILVSKVEKDSPAEDAGLQAGDVITDADGTIIKTSGNLINAMRDKKKGDEVDITYYRDGRRDTVTVISGETENQVFDVNTFIWCDKDEGEDCSGSYSFNLDKDAFRFDSEAFGESMEKLQQYFQGKDFQVMIQDSARESNRLEEVLQRKMEELERKLEQLEKQLQRFREKEETGSRYSTPRSLREAGVQA